MSRYSGLYAPVDGAFEQIARMAGLALGAPIVALTIAADARLWFPPSEGPADGTGDRTGPSPSAGLDLSGPGPVVLDDAAGDPRTAGHPWVRGRDGIRFLAVAPLRPPGGEPIGTLEVMDRKRHRRTTTQQGELLVGLAATVAQLLQVRMTSLAALRDEEQGHAAENRRRDDVDRRTAQLSQAATAARDRERPELCQLGGSLGCKEPAQLKIADSWGDSAWGCWRHAEDALVQVPSTFLATESPQGLQTYRNRRSRG